MLGGLAAMVGATEGTIDTLTADATVGEKLDTALVKMEQATVTELSPKIFEAMYQELAGGPYPAIASSLIKASSAPAV